MQEDDPSKIDPDLVSNKDALNLGKITEPFNAETISEVVDDFVCRANLPYWAAQLITGSILLLMLAVLAFLVFFIVRPFILKIFKGLVRRTDAKWDDYVVESGIAKWVSHFIAALLINTVIPGLFKESPEMARHLINFSHAYLIFSGLFMLYSILDGIRHIYERKSQNRKLPITSLAQVLKLISFLIAIVLLVSTFVEKSPLAFLGGIGVFTSVIMLVFKDAILGFVAGIQLTSNDMLKKGDWIEAPKHGADGDVLEVGLTTVKVLNFDKTITTIPTYSLISESFKNWRSMPESGGRRIKRSIAIDLKTVSLCSDEMLNRFRKIQYISDYIDQRLLEIQEYNTENGFDSQTSVVNGRKLTNIGTFRAYIEAYLRNHPQIHQSGMTLLVRQLSPGAEGVPIEIYCFSKIIAWADYEALQSDIFDHLLAIAKEFDLKVFQNPTEITISH